MTFSFQVVQQSIKITEPILCLRRVIIYQAKDILKGKVEHAIPFLDSLLGDLWLQSAKSARIAGVSNYIKCEAKVIYFFQ